MRQLKKNQKIKDRTTRASSPLYIQVLTVWQVSTNIVTGSLSFFFILNAVLLPTFTSQRICTAILYLYILPTRKKTDLTKHNINLRNKLMITK